MAEVAFGNDGDFSDANMILKVNNNLANELGNLCQRTLSMVYKNCNKAIPQPSDYTDDDKALLLESVQTLHERCVSAITEQAILTYIQVLVQVIRDANKYIDEQAPWSLRKTDPIRADTVLYVILEVLRHVAILYQPVIPTSAGKLLDQLAVPQEERMFVHLSKKDDNDNDDDETNMYKLKPGTPIAKPQVIFPRIELPTQKSE